jgi:hypothetical protein
MHGENTKSDMVCLSGRGNQFCGKLGVVVLGSLTRLSASSSTIMVNYSDFISLHVSMQST